MRMFILFILLLSSIAQGAASRECQRRFRVAVSPIAPVSYRDETGKLRGVARDLGGELIKKTGCRFSIEEESTFEVWRSLEKDRADITMINIENSTPAARFGRFISFYTMPRAFVVRKETLREGLEWPELLENRKLKFVGLIGVDFFYLPHEIGMLKKQKRYVEVVGIEEALNMIAQKRADVIISSPGATNINLQRLGLNDELAWVVDEKNLRRAGMYISKRRVNDEEFQMIKRAIDTLKDEGWFRDNLKRYLEATYPRIDQKKVPAKNPQ